jgi:hypothetical protein
MLKKNSSTVMFRGLQSSIIMFQIGHIKFTQSVNQPKINCAQIDLCGAKRNHRRGGGGGGMAPHPLLPPPPPPSPPPQLFRPPKIHQFFRRTSANPSPCLSDPAAPAPDSPCDGSFGVLNGGRSLGSVVTPRPAAGSRGSAAGGLGGLSSGSPA